MKLTPQKHYLFQGSVKPSGLDKPPGKLGEVQSAACAAMRLLNL